MVALDSRIWNSEWQLVTLKATPELFSTMTCASVQVPAPIGSDGGTTRSTIEVLGTAVGSEVVGATVVVVVVDGAAGLVTATVVETEMCSAGRRTVCGLHPVSRTVVPATRTHSLRKFPTPPTDPKV